MRLYLAAAWSRKAEIKAIAQELNNLTIGVHVGARWLDEEDPTYGGPPATEFRRERARIDVADVKSADVIVRFTDDLSSPTVPSGLASGARMFEMGYAYAFKKIIIVVGGIQPIFDYLPEIIHVEDIPALKEKLIELQLEFTAGGLCV
jgi:nucleoside 2-deoxyribosyltransferase